LGDYVSTATGLAEANAFLAARLVSSPNLFMFRLDSLAILAIIMIVMNLSVLRWLLK